MTPLTTQQARRSLAKQFDEAGLPDSQGEARDLLMAAAGYSRSDLITQGNDSLSAKASERLMDFAVRRLAGEPVDHILGWREFYGRRFKITADVLSPRQETEEVLSQGLRLIKNCESPRILDLGTGSGAIITTLLLERPHAQGVAVDLSEAALNIAAANAAAHNIQDRLTLLHSNWLEAVTGKFDLIISNPPYIDSKAMTELPREVSEFDPELSLHGGEDGLTPYRIIAANAAQHLKPNAALVFEIGYDQGEAVPQILTEHGFIEPAMFHDLAGLPRIVTARV